MHSKGKVCSTATERKFGKCIHLQSGLIFKHKLQRKLTPWLLHSGGLELWAPNRGSLSPYLTEFFPQV